MKLRFLGAAQIVTGSCFLLEIQEHKILVDCGQFQGSKAIKERNYNPFPFTPSEIKCVLLTHAHIDHSGLIPKLYKEGFSGPVITTKATVDLCRIMLPDSGHIQEMEVERKNRKLSRAGLPLLTPIYTSEEARECIRHFQGVEYNEMVQVVPGLRVRFRDAGHILGSAMIEIFAHEDGRVLKLVFSGDIGNVNQPFIEDPSCISGADYLIMESTYGNRLHEDMSNCITRLKDIINETIKKKGNLIIPAFAIERTQDLLYYINLLIKNRDIPEVDIYIDSPLAVAATQIFKESLHYFDEETKDLIRQGENPLELPKLHFCLSVDESRALNEVSGAIIIAASGMADAGRIKHHLKHNLWRSNSTVLFVGYQAEGTLGRRLLNGEKRVTIHGEEVAVNARIEHIDGFSAHADQEGILRWIRCGGLPSQGIILVHGEPDAQGALAQCIKAMCGIEPFIPVLGETFEWQDGVLSRIKPPQAGEMVPDLDAVLVPPTKEQLAFELEQIRAAQRAELERAFATLRMKLRHLENKQLHAKDLKAALIEVEELTRLVDKKLH